MFKGFFTKNVSLKLLALALAAILWVIARYLPVWQAGWMVK